MSTYRPEHLEGMREVSRALAGGRGWEARDRLIARYGLKLGLLAYQALVETMPPGSHGRRRRRWS